MPVAHQVVDEPGRAGRVLVDLGQRLLALGRDPGSPDDVGIAGGCLTSSTVMSLRNRRRRLRSAGRSRLATGGRRRGGVRERRAEVQCIGSDPFRGGGSRYRELRWPVPARALPCAQLGALRRVVSAKESIGSCAVASSCCSAPSPPGWPCSLMALFNDEITRAFNGSWFVPLIGWFLLPYTTLVYVLVVLVDRGRRRASTGSSWPSASCSTSAPQWGYGRRADVHGTRTPEPGGLFTSGHRGCFTSRRSSTPTSTVLVLAQAPYPIEGIHMAIKVGINGFGRIGRMVFRAAVQNSDDDPDRRHQRPARARLPGLHAQVRLGARPLPG